MSIEVKTCDSVSTAAWKVSKSILIGFDMSFNAEQWNVNLVFPF